MTKSLKKSFHTGTVKKTIKIKASKDKVWRKISNIVGLPSWLVDVTKTEYLSQKKILKPVLNLGLKDVFPEHGSRNEILKLNGLDIDSLKEQISKF